MPHAQAFSMPVRTEVIRMQQENPLPRQIMQKTLDILMF